MSQRLGMADGRCFTINTSNQLLNDYIMRQNGVQYVDNYSYRQLLQKQGPELIRKIESEQDSNVMRTPNTVSCQSCDKPLLRVPDIY